MRSDQEWAAYRNKMTGRTFVELTPEQNERNKMIRYFIIILLEIILLGMLVFKYFEKEGVSVRDGLLGREPIYQVSENPEEMIVYVNGTPQVLERDNLKLTLDANMEDIILVLPRWESLDGHWEPLAGTFPVYAKEQEIFRNPKAKEGEYPLMQKLVLRIGDKTPRFSLVANEKDSTKSTMIKVECKQKK